MALPLGELTERVKRVVKNRPSLQFVKGWSVTDQVSMFILNTSATSVMVI